MGGGRIIDHEESAVKLYVCWGTFQIPGARAHPCRIALEALRRAGHDPEVVRVYGAGPLPDVSRGRREVRRLAGSSWVPLLLTPDGEPVQESQAIVHWAAEHPAVPAAA